MLSNVSSLRRIKHSFVSVSALVFEHAPIEREGSAASHSRQSEDDNDFILQKNDVRTTLVILTQSIPRRTSKNEVTTTLSTESLEREKQARWR